MFKQNGKFLIHNMIIVGNSGGKIKCCFPGL